jgi:hypothetical protein
MAHWVGATSVEEGGLLCGLACRASACEMHGGKVALFGILQGFLRVRVSPVRIIPPLLRTDLSLGTGVIRINVLSLATLNKSSTFLEGGGGGLALHSECLSSCKV